VSDPSNATPVRLLVVDDDAKAAALVAAAARSAGYDVRVAESSADFKAAYGVFQPTVISLDLAMPDVDGIELMSWLAQAGCRARLVLVSGVGPDVLEAARRLGEAYGLQIAGALSKPADAEALLALLKPPGGKS
jgi:DNA-binding response OmpR family regulator